jgi:agmatine deiminase
MKAILPLLLPAFVLSCAPAPQQPAPVPEKDGFRMLPAWRLPEEIKIPGKADQFDEFRLKHPEWYAATAAPQGKKFRALLEWEEQQILLLAFPSASLGDSVTHSISQIATGAAPYVDVWIVSKAKGAQNAFVEAMKKDGLSQELIDQKIHFAEYEADSIWMIDFGPFPLVDEAGTIAFTDLRYYQNRVYDDALPVRFAQQFGITDYRGQMDFEGGNFVTDGEGRCYVTQGAFWENAGQSEDAVKKTMKDYLGCDSLVVLKPLDGEGTTHIDMFFKLVAVDKAVLGRYSETQDKTNYAILNDDKDILKAVDLGGGKTLDIRRIPMPDNTGSGETVWRTHTNSTFVKPVNLWPVYTQNPDIKAQAEQVWKDVLPEWTHVGVLSDEIITWGGAQHCVTRTIPKGKFEKWIPDGKCGTAGKCEAPEGGYKGTCKADADCFGPEHLCDCNDCASGCKPPVNLCGDVTFEGCCMPDGTLKYCDNNAVTSKTCGSYNKCGWDADNGWYDCNFSGEGPAESPKACKVADECKDVPAGGKCDADTLKWCESNALKTKDCKAEGKTCGPDPADATKSACIPMPCDNACQEGPAVCEGGAVVTCEKDASGCLVKKAVACEAPAECKDGKCEVPAADETPAVPDVPVVDAADGTGSPDAVQQDNPGADNPAKGDATKGGGGGGCSGSRVPALPWFLVLPFGAMVLVLRVRRG